MTYRVNVVNLLEPTFIVVALLPIWTHVAISAVKVSTSATVWTTSSTSTVLKHQPLTRTQTLTVVVIAVFSSFALAIEMVVVADLLVANTLAETGGGCLIGTWENSVDAFIEGVQKDALAGRCLFGRDIDCLGCAFAYGCP